MELYSGKTTRPNGDRTSLFATGRRVNIDFLLVSATQMFEVPNLAIMIIAATRMYRSLINLGASET